MVATLMSPLSSTPERPCVIGPCPSTATKGFGLKKWKRLKRNSAKVDSEIVYDNNKVLKRDFSMSANSVIASRPPGSNPVPRDSAGSSNISVNNLRVDVLSMAEDSHKFQLGTGTGFEFSRYSEDNSSRSSSAISAPKSSNAKGGKGLIETTKKLRGDTIKIDRGSSHCSGESESGSNFVVVQNVAFLYTDGIRTRNSTDNGEGSVDGAQQSDEQTRMDQNSGNSLDDFADGLTLEVDTTITSSDTSPFSSYTESMCRFQIVYEAVENELKKLVELTALARGLNPVGAKTTLEPSSTATNHKFCLEKEAGSRGAGEGRVVVGEEEYEELFRNLTEAEIKYVIILEAKRDHNDSPRVKRQVQTEVPPKGLKKIIFRTFFCFFIQLILLAALLLSRAPSPPLSTTTPTVLPT